MAKLAKTHLETAWEWFCALASRQDIDPQSWTVPAATGRLISNLEQRSALWPSAPGGCTPSGFPSGSIQGRSCRSAPSLTGIPPGRLLNRAMPVNIPDCRTLQNDYAAISEYIEGGQG